MKDYFTPVILGREFSTPSDLLDSLSFVRGNNMAKAAFEMAFSDLSAKEEGVSLSKFLLGTKSKVESGVSVGIQKDRIASNEVGEDHRSSAAGGKSRSGSIAK